jgi:hypothetical protein
MAETDPRFATVVFLRWLDACADADEWHAPADCAGLSELYACGFLVREDEEVIVIASLGKDVGPGRYRIVVRIPAAAVTHKVYLSVPAP